LNVTIGFDEDRVREEARAIDRARSRGALLGRLAGVPFVVKDQIEVAGYATTAGTPALRAYVSTRDAAVVAALRRAGAIPFAKANLHELASGGTSSNPTYGIVRNPYDLDRIPGGSSGGTAAAIAARIVPAGLAEDTGGSARIPAGFCGIAGLRPTGWPHKLYSDDGMVPPPAADDTQIIGPMARTVADVALLHAVITGTPVPEPRDIARTRIGIPSPAFWDDPHLERAVAWTARGAFATLADAGATLVEIDFAEVLAIGASLADAVESGSRARLADWLARNVPGTSLDDLVSQIASRDVAAIYAMPVPRAPTDLTPARRMELRAAANQLFAALFRRAGIDALAFPSPLILPPPINRDGDPVDVQVSVDGRWLSYRNVALRYQTFGARLGAPGLVVPAGLADGLPVGIELEALPGGDAALLAIGMAVGETLGPIPPPRALGP
jgi:mandelamide amidase